MQNNKTCIISKSAKYSNKPYAAYPPVRGRLWILSPAPEQVLWDLYWKGFAAAADRWIDESVCNQEAYDEQALFDEIYG